LISGSEEDIPESSVLDHCPGRKSTVRARKTKQAGTTAQNIRNLGVDLLSLASLASFG
jgi:hypothetical protein